MFFQMTLPTYFPLEQLLSQVFFSAEKDTTNPLNEEEQLIFNAQQNNKHFTPLYEKYYDRIFVFIHRRINNLDQTADLTSNVFYACLKNLKKYKFQGYPFSSWLFKIAVNEMNMFFRKQKQALRHVNIHDQGIDLFFNELDYHEQQLDRHKLITHFLELLEENELLFLELRFFEQRSFDEIGYLTDLTGNNAKVKTYRILKKLKKHAQSLNWEEFKWQR